MPPFPQALATERTAFRDTFPRACARERRSGLSDQRPFDFPEVARLGVFQYGLLHAGQTLGSGLLARGIQVWSQRQHCMAWTVTLGMRISIIGNVHEQGNHTNTAIGKLYPSRYIIFSNILSRGSWRPIALARTLRMLGPRDRASFRMTQ